jgi:hypothetical protein
MTLAEFLTARLDEDEAAAKAASRFNRWHVEPWYSDPAEHKRADVWGNTGAQITGNGALDAEDAIHIARHDPARVLREAGAKRKILADVIPLIEEMDQQIASEFGIDPEQEDAHLPLLRILAAIYSDHPDYDETWKP